MPIGAVHIRANTDVNSFGSRGLLNGVQSHTSQEGKVVGLDPPGGDNCMVG